MIKVKSITIKEFRGIRNLTLDLGGKNFAVCGPNGTGKSGIVDALEFALTGSISRLSGAGNAAIHYNEWATLHKQDFTPVVDAYKALVATFYCGTCNGNLFITPHAGKNEALRCNCGVMNLNLIKKS